MFLMLVVEDGLCTQRVFQEIFNEAELKNPIQVDRSPFFGAADHRCTRRRLW